MPRQGLGTPLLGSLLGLGLSFSTSEAPPRDPPGWLSGGAAGLQGWDLRAHHPPPPPYVLQKEGEFTLHSRAILEMEQYIRETHPDAVKICNICHSLLIQVPACAAPATAHAAPTPTPAGGGSGGSEDNRGDAHLSSGSPCSSPTLV